MHFVTSGAFAYYLGYDVHPLTIVEATFSRGYQEPRYVSEATLWTTWKYCGRLTGEAQCSNLVQLCSERFHDLIRNSTVTATLCKYAALFVQYMGQADTMITDLWGSADNARKVMRDLKETERETNRRSFTKIMMMWNQDEMVRQVFQEWKHYARSRRKSRSESCWEKMCGYLRTKRNYGRATVHSEQSAINSFTEHPAVSRTLSSPHDSPRPLNIEG